MMPDPCLGPVLIEPRLKQGDTTLIIQKSHQLRRDEQSVLLGNLETWSRGKRPWRRNAVFFCFEKLVRRDPTEVLGNAFSVVFLEKGTDRFILYFRDFLRADLISALHLRRALTFVPFYFTWNSVLGVYQGTLS